MMDEEKDYYAILGVSETADAEEIKRAYRQKAKQLHPDRAGAASTPAFQDLQTAYEVLSDPHKRAAYDRHRRRMTPVDRLPSRPGPSGGWNLYPDGCRRRGLYAGCLDVYCDPEERARGTVLRLATRLDIPCRLCRGWFLGLPGCPACRGSGWTSRPVFLDIPITPAMYRQSYWHAERCLGGGLCLCLDLRLHTV